MQRIREGLYLLEAAQVVNCYLIEGGQGLTLVDAGPASRLEALLGEIVHGGFGLDELQRIVLTHAHPANAGAAAALLKRRRVKVYAHPEDIPVLEGRAKPPRAQGLRGWLRAVAGRLALREPLFSVVAASPQEPIRGLPQWQVLHVPGHTPGSLALFDPAHGVLLCGDALSHRGGRLRVADGAAVDAHAALQSAANLAGLNAEVACFGRGPVLRPRAWMAIEALLPSSGR